MKNCFKKHFAHYALAMIGLGLGALSHAADAPGAKSAGNITQSIPFISDADTPAVSGDHTYGWHWRRGILLDPAASITVNGVTVYDQPNTSYRAVTAVRDQLYANLQSGLDTAIRGELSKVRDFKWSTVSIAGPIDLGIQPNGAGASTFSLGGFSTWIGFNLSGNLDDWFGTSYQCNATINTGPLTMTGNLDLVTGTTSNAGLLLGNPNVSASCSTGFGVIPGVSLVTDYIINNMVGKINDNLQQLKIPLQSVSFMGLNTALPYHSFPVQPNSVCPQGCYLGDQIRDGLIPLVQGASIALHFNPKIGLLYAPRGDVSPEGPNHSNGVTYIENDEAVSISLGGGSIKLTVYDTTRFRSWYGCEGGNVCDPSDE